MRQVDSAYLKMLARMDYKASYEFRLIDQHGRVYPIPSRAVLNRSRGGEVDSGTWRLSLSLDAGAFPRGVDPQQYNQLRAFRKVAGKLYPYFTGVIDKPESAWRTEVQTISNPVELEAFGVLQYAKGYRVDAVRFDPAVHPAQLGNPEILTGICTTTRHAPNTVVTSGGTEKLPAGPVRILGTGDVSIYTDATLTTKYSTANYSVNTSVSPVEITWNITPSQDRVFEYARLNHFAKTLAPAAYRVLPYGRDPNDLMHTYITSIDPSHPLGPRIEVADPGSWLAFVEETEFVCITTSDGTEHISEITLIYPEGVFFLDSGTPLPGVTVGDPVRISTTEAYSAWDDDRLYRFYTAAVGGQEFNRTLLTPHPNLGIVTAAPRNWTEGVYARVWHIREDVPGNRVEEGLKSVLVNTGLFAPGDITTEFTGAYMKNYARAALDLSDVIAEFKDQALPPNAYVHDTPEGQISIKPYRQKPEPDWVLRGASEIQETESPEPITAVTVIAEGEAVNKASEWFYSSDNFTNPTRAIDNNSQTTATPTVNSTSATITFRIPAAVPQQLYPLIDSVKVSGVGLLTVYATAPSGGTFYLAGWTFKPLASGTVEIPGDELVKILAYATQEEFMLLSFQFDPLTSGTSGNTVATAASVSEIQILTKRHGVWQAALIDDPSKAPADGMNGADSFGFTWRQADPERPISYRFAPTDYLSRVSVRYSGVGNLAPRHHVMTLTGISQQDCREYAERWQDEFLRAGKTYTVVAPLDDRAELGDTVRVFWPDKTYRDLFLWGMSDQGGPNDHLCTYTLIDYGL